MATAYADPLAGAHVTPKRIDQGVDYAGTGPLSAIARGVVTKILLGQSASGWPGNYVEYKVTQPGPLFGKSIYYAEGVTPASGLKVGDTVNAGQQIATLIPGWGSGIEVGYASGVGSASYATEYGGGYRGDNDPTTAAGTAFSDLIKSLGGPGGVSDNAPYGTAPPNSEQLAGGLAKQQQFLKGVQGGLIQSTANTIGSGIDATQAIANFVSNPTKALLTIVFVVGGALMIFSGAGKVLGFDTPVKSTISKLPKVPVIPE